METLRDLFEHVVSSQKGRKELVRVKQGGRWIAYSTAEFEDAVRSLAAGLIVRGIEPGDRIALYSENRPEWHFLDFACHLTGAVLVPLYPNLPADQIRFIVKDSGARLRHPANGRCPSSLKVKRPAGVQSVGCSSLSGTTVGRHAARR